MDRAIVNVRIPSGKNGGSFGQVRAIMRDGEEPLYFCHDFEKLMDFRSLKCSTLSYLVGNRRAKVGGRLVLATWDAIRQGLKRIRKTNNVVLELIDRDDPAIPVVKHNVDVKISKLGARLGSMSYKESIPIMANLHNAVLDPLKFSRMFPDFPVEIKDVFELSAVEFSGILFNAMKQQNAEDAKMEEEQQKKKIDVHIPKSAISTNDGRQIIININIDGVGINESK